MSAMFVANAADVANLASFLKLLNEATSGTGVKLWDRTTVEVGGNDNRIDIVWSTERNEYQVDDQVGG